MLIFVILMGLRTPLSYLSSKTTDFTWADHHRHRVDYLLGLIPRTKQTDTMAV
jgi:hypothetical protein